MRKCEKCGTNYDEELSAMTFAELRDIDYDPKLLSDSSDIEYCSKKCQRQVNTEQFEAMSEDEKAAFIGISVGSIANAKRMKRDKTFDLRDVKDSPINQMERDKAMVRQIKNGKASDPGLKKEAETIQREHESNRQQKIREKDKRELGQMRKDFGMMKNPELRKQYANEGS